jgi:nicotinamide mononucleotide adenylyltransferase
MNKIFILGLILMMNILVFSKGIIIGDDLFILKTFRDGKSEDIQKIVNNIDGNFDEVIIHMGRANISERGNFFFYRTSKENLKYFANLLEERGIKLYLWFFDSFGSDDFLSLYNDRLNLINSNKNFIESLNITYEGIVVDFEWINLGEDENTEKYMEFLKDIKNIFSDKKIMAFTNTIDSEYENTKRGYDLKKMVEIIDGMIPMLYVVDFGIYYENNGIKMNFSDARIKNLLNFYSNYEKVYPAFSFTSGLLLVRNDQVFYIKDISHLSIPDGLEIVEKKEYEYHNIYKLNVKKDVEITRNDGVSEKIKKGEILFILEVKEQVYQISDYIWNYTFYF